jgi:hypothetical protein
VSLALAKDQRLSLNPSQISGGCGRLLCCLRYEHDFYVTSRKRFPKEGREIRTTRGPEKVVSVDIFRERLLLRAEDGSTRTLMLADLRQETEAAGGVLELPQEHRAPSPPIASEDAATVALTESAADPSRPQAPRRRRRGRRRNRRRPGPDAPPPPPSEPGEPGGE